MPNRKIFFDQPIQTTFEPITCSGSVITPNPGIVLPFATGGSATTTVTLSTNSSGASNNVMILGFGNYYSSGLTLTSGTFTPSTTTVRVYSFIMPYEATLNNIFMEAILGTSWTPTGTSGNVQYYPYVAVATAPQGDNTFTILSDTITPISNPFLGGTAHASNTIRAGSSTNLGIQLSTGTKVAIVAGLMTQGTGTLNQSWGYFYFTGGLWFT